MNDATGSRAASYVIRVPGSEPVVLPACEPGWRWHPRPLAVAAAIIAGKRPGDYFRLAKDGVTVTNAWPLEPGEYELVSIGRIV